MPGLQKNVRLPELATEELRALKYDLDAGDGETIAQALEEKTLERLRYHAAVVRRVGLGLLFESEATRSRAAMAALLAALNAEGERVRIEDGRVQRLGGDGRWTAGMMGFSGFSDEAQAIVTRTVDLVKELCLPRATVGVLVLACCEHPRGERCAGLGVPVKELATRLRGAFERRRQEQPPADVAFTLAAKSVLMEGSIGLAALDGIGKVEVEHILVAALQRADDEVAEAYAGVDIHGDEARAALWG